MARTAWLVLTIGLFASACSLFNHPIDGNGVGVACADSSAKAQSTCESGLSCLPISSKNMCGGLGCTANSDCGKTSDGLQNYCLTLPELTTSVGCLRGCDPDAGAVVDGGTAPGGPCGRSDFFCAHNETTGDNFCLPDCRLEPAGFCSYGTYCDESSGADAGPTSGECIAMTCSNSADCPAGLNYICAPVNGHSLCVPDCAAVTCAAGTTCNAGGGCDTTLVELYQPCGAASGQCDTANKLKCAAFASTSICLQTCTASSSCPGASASEEASICAVGDGASDYCLVQCVAGYSACPTGLSCQTLSSSSTSSSGTYCLP